MRILRKKCKPLNPLPTDDPHSLFHEYDPETIHAMLGWPQYALSKSSKAEKSLSVGILSRTLFFTSGIFCPCATKICRGFCIGWTAGYMVEPRTTKASDQRTAAFICDEARFVGELLYRDLEQLLRDAIDLNVQAGSRLNGASDILFERRWPELFSAFRDIDFYDYTKCLSRYEDFLDGRNGNQSWPENYHLTFSRGEAVSDDEVFSLLEAGGNIAIVFSPRIPRTWHGFNVIDGDKHDARFLDEPGAIIGLREKGNVIKDDQSGFVVRIGERRTRYPE